jgi:hypothetical protein
MRNERQLMDNNLTGGSNLVTNGKIFIANGMNQSPVSSLSFTPII